MKISRFILFWGIFFCVGLLVRLPFFLSKNFFFDLDEAVIGEMAFDFLDGKGLTFYFYGQNYGFSTIETLSASMFMLFLGKSIWTLKLAGIFLYSLGSTFLYSALESKMTKGWMKVLFVLLVAGIPSWYLWGGQLRGGYLTAFLCLSILFYLIEKKSASTFLVLLASLIFACGYESHVLLVVPIFLLLLWWIWKTSERKLRNLLLFNGGWVAFVYFAKYMFTTPWYGTNQVSFDLQVIQHNSEEVFSQFLHSFTGFYFYQQAIDIPSYWFWLSFVCLIVIMTTIVYSLIRAEGDAKVKLILLGVGAFASLVIGLLSPGWGARYLLGFNTVLIIMFLVAVINLEGKQRLLLSSIVGFLFVIGISTGSKHQKHWYHSGANEMNELKALYSELNQLGTKALYGSDIVMVWNYLYGDKIPCVHVCGFERTPRYENKVRAIESAGGKRSFFAHQGFQSLIFDPNNIPVNEDVSKKYFVVPDFTDEDLQIAKEKLNCGY